MEEAGHKLSRRECEVLNALAEIGHAKGVANQLKISQRTVEAHLASARAKLGCDTTIRLLEVYRSRAPVQTGPATGVVRQSRAVLQARKVILAIGGLLLVVMAAVLTFMPSKPPSPTRFFEAFDGPKLEGWQVRRGAGSISLTKRPGWLRYSLTEYTPSPPREQSAGLMRTIVGSRFRCFIRCQVDLPGEQHGRQFFVSLTFGDKNGPNTSGAQLTITRDIRLSSDSIKDLSRGYKVLPSIIDEGNHKPFPNNVEHNSETMIIMFQRIGSTLIVAYSHGRSGEIKLLNHTFKDGLGDRQLLHIFSSAYDDKMEPRGIAGKLDLDAIWVEPQ